MTKHRYQGVHESIGTLREAQCIQQPRGGGREMCGSLELHFRTRTDVTKQRYQGVHESIRTLREAQYIQQHEVEGERCAGP